MRRRLTKEEIVNREPDLLSGEYKVLGKYYGPTVKIPFKHMSCGCEWRISITAFHRGVRCPKCVVRKPVKPTFTKEIFIEREEDIKSGEYLMLGEYIKSNVKTLFKHSTCGYEWETKPANFHAGYRCPKCSLIKRAKRRRLTKEEFVNREPDILNGDYEFIGKYKGANIKTLFKHNDCNYEWGITPCDFHAGRRCPRCKKHMGLTKEEFCDRESDIASGRYVMLGEYKNNHTKTLFRHSACGYEWKTTPSIFQRGKRCPRCKQSKGEKRIADVLDKLNIPFEAQKRFDSCKYKNTLPFDFYVSDILLIEYDGEQHFKPVDFTGKGNEWADKSFKSGQLRDNIKTQWAKDNGIPLVRIPYTEFDNIEQIIKDNIEKYSIQKAG
ncbi:hypothetical protein AB0X79_07925 [Pediococcus pentosaceus]|uniref:hypothetical protein n=1 Tax=Pediococcus pentosaceus TaxID=1255 RepID=UPI003F21392D